jgi:hypothetical protein
MKKISVLFDYYYYRVTKLYTEKNWEKGEGGTAVVSLTFFQSMVIIDSVGFPLFYFTDDLTRKLIISYLKPIIVILMVVLFFYNWKKYKFKFWAFKKRWESETLQQIQIRWIIILLVFLMPIVLPFIFIHPNN